MRIFGCIMCMVAAVTVTLAPTRTWLVLGHMRIVVSARVSVIGMMSGLRRVALRPDSVVVTQGMMTRTIGPTAPLGLV